MRQVLNGWRVTEITEDVVTRLKKRRDGGATCFVGFVSDSKVNLAHFRVVLWICIGFLVFITGIFSSVIEAKTTS